ISVVARGSRHKPRPRRAVAKELSAMMVPHGGANCTARFLFPSYWRLGNSNSFYPSAARVLQIACHLTVTVNPLHA
ncbi:hypothetical protein ASPFODRAFT_54976, partial [Aspergillus luchuensis CBS 106.47]